MTARAPDPGEILSLIPESLSLDTLRGAGITISTINLKKPTMDDVFVFYTGKEIRDEGQQPARGGFLRAARH